MDEDPLVARRRRIVTAASTNTETTSTPKPLELTEVWRLLEEHNSEFLEACRLIDTSDESESVSRLARVLADHREFHLRLAVTPKLRPHAAAWRAVEEVAVLEDEIVAHYMRALQAATPEEGEQEGAAGQEAINLASARLDRLAKYMNQAERLNEVDLADEWGDLAAGARGAFVLSGAIDALEFEQNGVGLYERITRSRDCPPGFGVRLQVVALIAETYFDPTRFWTTAARAFEIVSGATPEFERLVHDAAWQAEMVEVTREARDAGYELAAVTQHENRNRQLRAAIRFGHVVAERLAPPHLATLLVVRASSSFEEQRRKPISSLLNEIEQAELGELIQGIDRALRHGDAHKLYRIDSNGVTFTADRREYDFLTDEELINRVLLGFESLVALNLGITAALPKVGIELDQLEALMLLDTPDADKARLALSLSGWTDVRYERENGVVRTQGTRPAPSRFGVVAMLVPYLPADVDHLVLEAHDVDGVHIAEGPIEPFRRWAVTDDEFGRNVAFIEAMGRWTFDGVLGFPVSFQRKLLALQILKAFDDAHPPTETLRRLRQLHDAAGKMSLEEVSAAAADALRLRRETARGGRSSVDARRLVRTLETWALADVPKLRQTW